LKIKRGRGKRKGKRDGQEDRGWWIKVVDVQRGSRDGGKAVSFDTG